MTATDNLPPRDDYPELLRDLRQTVARLLGDVGVEADRALAIGSTVAEELSALHGGQVIYWPKATRYRANQRWAQIYDEFNGHNHAELAHKYGMGLHHLYRVIAIVRAERRKRTQKDLFQADDASKPGAGNDDQAGAAA